MLLSKRLTTNRFTTKVGFPIRNLSDCPYGLIKKSNGRDQFLSLAIYFASVLAILFSSRIVLGDDVASKETLGFESTAIPVGIEISKQCPETILPLPMCISGQSELSQIYEISTRHLCDRFRSINFDQPNVEVNKWSGNCWLRSDVEEALPSGGTGLLTIIYVHGNFMDRNNALERVRIVDRYLQAQTDRPYRILMLSWPSQREAKPLRDVLMNAESAECQSLYVAWMLQRLRDEPQVSLLGFSFGARAVTGGLHLDAGGAIPGYACSPKPNFGPSLNYRIGLVAPAIDRNWIERNGRHQLAMTHVESMVNLYNSKDPILRRFRFMDRSSRPIAAGFAGFTGFAGFAGLTDPRATTPLTGQPRIRQYDCGWVIGTTHAEKSYYGECPYFQTILQHVLWKDPWESTCNAYVVP